MATKRATKKKEPVTYKDFLAVQWEQWGSHHSHEAVNIPEPSYQFTVGEKVLFGALNDCVVAEVLEGGKILHLNFHDKGKVYGKDYDAGRKPRLCWWTEVDPLALEGDTKFSRERLNTNYIQTSLDSLIHMAYHRGLLDSPDYQRGYVWTLEDKQKLIQSIFNLADIGKFVFLEDDNYHEYRLEVIDGKQRLRAILDFYEGRFEFEGKTWYQLSRQDKYAFCDIMIQAATLQRGKVKRSDVLWLFLQLNAGGVPQTEEHIAHARKLYEEAIAKESNG